MDITVGQDGAAAHRASFDDRERAREPRLRSEGEDLLSLSLCDHDLRHSPARTDRTRGLQLQRRGRWPEAQNQPQDEEKVTYERHGAF
jgi:hypothetical protein